MKKFSSQFTDFWVFTRTLSFLSRPLSSSQPTERTFSLSWLSLSSFILQSSKSSDLLKRKWSSITMTTSIHTSESLKKVSEEQECTRSLVSRRKSWNGLKISMRGWLRISWLNHIRLMPFPYWQMWSVLCCWEVLFSMDWKWRKIKSSQDTLLLSPHQLPCLSIFLKYHF